MNSKLSAPDSELEGRSHLTDPAADTQWLGFRNVVLVVVLTTAVFWLIFYLSEQPHQNAHTRLHRTISANQQYGQSIMKTANAFDLLAPLPEGVVLNDVILTPVAGSDVRQPLILSQKAKDQSVLVVFLTSDRQSYKQQLQPYTAALTGLGINIVVVMPPSAAEQGPFPKSYRVVGDANATVSRLFGVADPQRAEEPWPSVFWVTAGNTIGYQKVMPNRQLLTPALLLMALKNRIAPVAPQP